MCIWESGKRMMDDGQVVYVGNPIFFLISKVIETNLSFSFSKLPFNKFSYIQVGSFLAKISKVSK